MEYLPAIQGIIQTLGGAGTVVVLLVVYQLYRNGFFKKKDEVEVNESMLNLMRELKHHYNDETTDLLREILQISRQTLDESKKTNTKLYEFEKYGIRQK